MTNLLTPNEAANYLRTEANDPSMLMLLSAIDQFVKRATGRNWSADTTIHPLAKAAAGMLLVQWYDHPAMVGNDQAMPFGLLNVLTQLEAEALKYRKYSFEGANGSGSVCIPIAQEGDSVLSLTGISAGYTGDQSALFESVVSEEGLLKQLDGTDHSEHWFVVILKNPADDITA